MKAALLYGPRDLRVEQVPDPEVGPGCALIRIEACGVCPSDVRGYLGVGRAGGGRLPRTPGHEWAGVVVALGPPGPEADGGPTPPLRAGDRVVADWRYVCGRCPQCRRGAFNYCEQLRSGVRGGFAEYGVAPLGQLRRVPDGLALEEASFCEPLACVLNAHAATPIGVGEDVAVLGAGPIGLLHAQLALRRGARVIVSDPLPARLEVARSLGVHDTVPAGEADPVERVRALTGGRGADAVFVAVGSVEAARQALAMAALHARINLFAGTYPPAELALDPNLVHYRQLVLTGSHDFTPHHFTTALKLLAFGIVRVAPLIRDRLDLDGVREAFETTAGRRGLKSMVLPAARAHGAA
jgi:L-iditol 2-dehydrogenase